MVKLFEDLITLLFLIFSLHGTAFAPIERAVGERLSPMQLDELTGGGLLAVLSGAGIPG